MCIRDRGHVFRFWDALDADAKRRLVRQAAALDLPALLRGFAATRAEQPRALARMEPAPVEAAPEYGGSRERFRAAGDAGEELLRAGRAAVMVVAGGQA